MSRPETTVPAANPWWRERWVGLAVLTMVLQLAGFWAVSPEPGTKPRNTSARQDAYLTDPAGAQDVSVLDAWCWLLTPAVFLLPSAEDFSGLAWMRGDPGGLEAEVFELPFRPLPWESLPGGVSAGNSWPRLDPGPARGWGGPLDGVPIPTADRVPLPTTSRVRVIAGLAGRTLRTGGHPGAASEARIAAARAVVVRVTVDREGELADPPVVWEPSDLAAADEAALTLARGLAFSPSEAGLELESGLVMVEWASPSAVEEAALRNGTKSKRHESGGIQ